MSEEELEFWLNIVLPEKEQTSETEKEA